MSTNKAEARKGGGGGEGGGREGGKKGGGERSCAALLAPPQQPSFLRRLDVSASGRRRAETPAGGTRTPP